MYEHVSRKLDLETLEAISHFNAGEAAEIFLQQWRHGKKPPLEELPEKAPSILALLDRALQGEISATEHSTLFRRALERITPERARQLEPFASGTYLLRASHHAAEIRPEVAEVLAGNLEKFVLSERSQRERVQAYQLLERAAAVYPRLGEVLERVQEKLDPSLRRSVGVLRALQHSSPTYEEYRAFVSPRSEGEFAEWARRLMAEAMGALEGERPNEVRLRSSINREDLFEAAQPNRPGAEGVSRETNGEDTAGSRSAESRAAEAPGQENVMNEADNTRVSESNVRNVWGSCRNFFRALRGGS